MTSIYRFLGFVHYQKHGAQETQDFRPSPKK